MHTLAAGSTALPLSDEQTQRVQQSIAGLTSAQLQWLSGYMAGVAAAEGPASLPVAEPGKTLTVLYGSQTGNGQAVAESLAQRSRDQGFTVQLASLADFKPANLKRASLLTLVISTHGEGDPPDDAELLHEFVYSERAPKLPGLSFSVLALGDSSYANFCETGRQFDARFEELGARRVEPLVECDLDYEDAARAWSTRIIERLPELISVSATVPHLRAVSSPSTYGKHNPFPAEVLVKQKITGAGSTKDVYHIELSLEGSGLNYAPGDALAVIADNPPQLVAEILELLGVAADTEIEIDDLRSPISTLLRQEFEITTPSLGFLKAWSSFAMASELDTLLEPGQQGALSVFLDTHQIIDVVRKYPAHVAPSDFVRSLRKLSPRSYSIASSQQANPDEVHLTVGVVRYYAFGTEHWGAASTHLGDRIAVGSTVSVYVQPNSRFRLPGDDTAIIMIGPGTGVAPFRAFVEERAERNATGKNWLFFGDRNFASDYLYQLEWHRHRKQNRLQRMDVAFSRDQDHKIYVQQRIVERGADIYRWLEDGAVIYVCGDAKRMAGDVNEALIEVLAQHGNMTAAEAAGRLKELRRAGRYQRDVY